MGFLLISWKQLLASRAEDPWIFKDLREKWLKMVPLPDFVNCDAGRTGPRSFARDVLSRKGREGLEGAWGRIPGP